MKLYFISQASLVFDRGGLGVVWCHIDERRISAEGAMCCRSNAMCDRGYVVWQAADQGSEINMSQVSHLSQLRILKPLTSSAGLHARSGDRRMYKQVLDV